MGSDVDTPAPAAAQTAGAPTAPRSPLRILLAEDNGVNQRVALRLLERLGFRADLAASGLEVLAAFAHQDYDVVLMDVQMPELDGLEAARRLRAELPAHRQPRIVAMTASALPGDREACLAAGMDDYLTKPVLREALAAALGRAAPPPHAPRNELDQATVRRLCDDLGPGFGADLAALVASYRQQLRADVAHMAEAAAAGESRLVALLAHRLRGASATLGAWRAAQTCRELECEPLPAAERLALCERLAAEGEAAAELLAGLAAAAP